MQTGIGMLKQPNTSKTFFSERLSSELNIVRNDTLVIFGIVLKCLH